MTKLARVVAVVAALYLSLALVWDGARYPFMGVDYTLYGNASRPAELVGKPWAAEQMKLWASTFDVDVVVSGSPQKTGVIAGYSGHVGSEFDRWLKSGYPCFKRPCYAKPLSLADNPKEINSFEAGVTNLSFMGSNARVAAGAAQEYYATRGWKTGIQELSSPGVWLSRFQVLFPQVMFLVAILIFMLTAGHTLSRGRSVGIQLLQGNPRWQIALGEALVWTFWLWVGATLVLGCTYLGSLVMVDGHFFLYIARTYAAIVFIFWAVGLLGSFIAHQILRATGILEAIKGRLRFGASFPIMYILRSVVVVLCAILLLSLTQTSSDLQAGTALRSQLGPLGAFSSFGVNTGVGDNKAVQAATTMEMAPLFADGHLVVTRAAPQFFYVTSPDLDATIHDGGDKMVAEVNAEYLKMVPTRLANGHMLNPAVDLDDSRVTLLFPEGTSNKVEQDIRSYVAQSMFSTGRLGSVPGWDIRNVPVKEMVAAKGNYHYAMNSGVFSRIANPIVIVFPNRFTLGSDFIYSSEGILARTADIPEVLRRSPSLSKGITGFDPVAKGVEERLDGLNADLIRELFELVAYLILLPLSTVALVLMYTRQHARRIFAQTINGRSFVEIAPIIIILDLVTLCATAWFARPRAPTLDQLRVFGENASTAPLRNFVTVVAVLISLMVAEYILFKRTQQRIVVERGGAA